MKSSSGAHFIGLDHIRALAAFLVFGWHFSHDFFGFPLPFEINPSFFPLALIDEGHVGVALFMVLSGYLFAKLLDGKRIKFGAFLWNRGLRLLPLLVLVVTLVGIRDVMSGDKTVGEYALRAIKGLVLPTLPNGGWSITVEFHFYLVLPILLWAMRRSIHWGWALLASAIAVRTGLFVLNDTVQNLAYTTIVGRIDQFIVGIMMFHLRGFWTGKHLRVGLIALVFTAFYWAFAEAGGFYRMPSYPSPSPLWIVMPTIEGLAFGAFIAWYDTSFRFRNEGISYWVAQYGAYSYSIYLLHFFIVFKASRFIHENVSDLTNPYFAYGWSAVFFLAMLPIAYASFRLIEKPFLALRKPYLRT